VTPRNWAFDVALAAVVMVVGQLEAWTGLGETHRQGPEWVQAVLYAVTALLLVGRRWRPLAVLAAMVAVSVVEFAAVGSPEGNAVVLAPLVAIYTAARLLPWRRAWLALVLALVLVTAWAALDPMNRSASEAMLAMVWSTPAIIAWLLGALVRATQLNVEQRRAAAAQRAGRAAAEERAQIARELHDVLGHSVSVMTVQASAVRRRLRPDQAVEREALESVEAVGREAMAEMRRMVRVLRSGDGAATVGGPGDLAPAPGLDQLPRLVDQFREAGLPVHYAPVPELPRLAPGLDLTAYRIVQEGLTNALRHARGLTRAEVSVDVTQDRLVVSVRDDGRPGGPRDEAGAAPGAGLLGMRERISVYGGSLLAGRRDEGGFQLVASLPTEAP
jgi:signal transduction histidine kinase